MPSGSGSGVVHSTTFTPAVAGRLIVTVTFEAQGNAGSAWGSSYRACAFMNQGSNVLGEFAPLANARTPHTVRGVFDVAAGTLVECGLWGQISGAVSCDFYNININWELIKR